MIRTIAGEFNTESTYQGLEVFQGVDDMQVLQDPNTKTVTFTRDPPRGITYDPSLDPANSTTA